MHDAALDERRLARRAAEIADVVRRGSATVDHVAEEVLVAELAQPAKDVLGLEDVDAGAKRDGER